MKPMDIVMPAFQYKHNDDDDHHHHNNNNLNRLIHILILLIHNNFKLGFLRQQ